MSRSDSGVFRRAKELAAMGQVDESVTLLRRSGAVEHAAAVLMRVKRPFDAGNLLIDSLGMRGVGEVQLQERLPKLSPPQKERALKAAICFGRAKETNRAVAIYVALGETRRAADLLARAGEHARAARLRAGGGASDRKKKVGADASAKATVEEELAFARDLEKAGKHAVAIQHYLRLGKLQEAARLAYELKEFRQAAELYCEADNYYNAAVCLIEAGERREALDYFLQLDPEHPQFRNAMLRAARITVSLDVMDFSTESMLSELINAVPRDSREIDVYYRLGRHFERHRLPQDARRAYEQILLVSDYKDTRRRIQALVSAARPKETPEQTMGMTSATPNLDMGDLPDLPALPSLPEIADLAPLTDEEFANPEAEEPLQIVREVVVNPTPPPSEPKQVVLEAKKLKPGTILADRYAIEGKVGRGGMAAVYRAVDQELEEHVAIKVFTRDDSEEVSLQRFRQEVSLTRRLSHPNVVQLFDIGESHGLRFLTMELLDGRDLAAFLRKPVDFTKGLHWLIQACRGLYAAHKAGVVHRDIKPANIFVCRDGRVKLVDFGIAKRSNVPGVTQKGLAWGTPRYMAPEQIRGFSNVSPASDIYSIGVIAYQMFSGKVPFDHKEQVPLLMMHINDKPKPPGDINPKIPPELGQAILKCLEKKPDNRFASAKDLANALRTVAKSLPT